MNEREIFVVVGQTGEYSDACEWLVAAYSNESDAQKHVEEATRVARAIAVLRESDGHDARGAANPYDPQMTIDYTGTTYSVARVAVPERFERLPISDAIGVDFERLNASRYEGARERIKKLEDAARSPFLSGSDGSAEERVASAKDAIVEALEGYVEELRDELRRYVGDERPRVVVEVEEGKMSPPRFPQLLFSKMFVSVVPDNAAALVFLSYFDDGWRDGSDPLQFSIWEPAAVEKFGDEMPF